MERFVKILIQAQEIHSGHLDTLKARVANVRSKLEEVNVTKDQGLFATYNIRTFNAPGDWGFEPSPIHYDTVGFAFIFAAIRGRLTKNIIGHDER